MNIHYLQHADYESPVHIHAWAENRGYPFIGHQVHQGDSLPELDDFDMLVVMGGPMGVHDEEQYPWLKQEKQLIREAVSNGKLVLGICLGHQLLADALGGTVGKSPQPETGFFDVTFLPGIQDSPVFGFLAGETVKACQIHGDAVLKMPQGARQIASNDACPVQAFELNGGKVVGLQFHLELTAERLEDVFLCAPNYFKKNEKYTHSIEKMRSEVPKYAPHAHEVLEQILDNMVNA
ncbi:type 1 glutamine amidotransferase [Candidatus Micrarchaeota archaeon]|nr:type 1 glutamine amidotransferase [Candidatus Micrarchaeota archaeon]